MGNENPHALPALNEEARRRGMTYGQLQQEETIRKMKAEALQAKRRKSKKKGR